jgi:hypothetical protein
VHIRIPGQCENIPAHRYVLAVQSSVFRAMFKASIQETSTNIVVIPDFPTPVVRELVRFLYEDRCHKEVLEEHAQHLLAMADKYDVQGLAKLCEAFLIDNMNVSNAIALLQLAEEYRADAFKARVLTFLRTNFDEMADKGSFQDVTADTLRDIFVEVSKYK